MLGTAEAIIVKCCTQIGYMKSQHSDDKCPIKRAWYASWCI